MPGRHPTAGGLYPMLTPDMVAVSPDGLSWSMAQVADNARSHFSAIAGGNSRLVAVSWAGGEGLSTDVLARMLCCSERSCLRVS